MSRRCISVLLCLACVMLSLAGGAEADSATVVYLKKEDARPALPSAGWFEVHVISSGGGDCMLLRCGESAMLVDSGIYKGAGRVVEYLHAIGVEHLTYALLTHPHDDHLGGYRGILEEIPAGMFLWPPLYETYRDDLVKNMTARLTEWGIPVEEINVNAPIAFGEAVITFFQLDYDNISVNDRSVVMRVQFGARSILLTADLESPGQKALAAAYGEALSADIIKIPHHGITGYKKVLHEAVRPSLALFTNQPTSIGPAIEAAQSTGGKALFTSGGTIVCATDGETWQVWQVK